MEIYQEGKVSEILVQPVTKVPVGTVLARLATAVEFVVEEVDASKDAALVKTEPHVEYVVNVKKEMAVPVGTVIASPVVRKRAQEQHLDLSNIKR